MKPEFYHQPPNLMEVRSPYSTEVGILGRFFRLLWAPIAYVLGIPFKL